MRSRRIALIAFIVVLLYAAVLYVRLGRRYWFLMDEWSFLVSRDGGSARGLFEPHSEHWSTVPVISYRALWHVFGLHTYRPYQGLVIGLHLTTAVLLRVIVRRLGVGPWIATAAAAMFVFLGAAAWNNIVWAFQVGFTLSMVCGLAHLLLTDHDGRFDRRDAIGLGFGAVGLMSSGVAPTMVIVVGVAALIRRGWRLAALHTVPLGLLYGVWYVLYGRDTLVWENRTPTLRGVFDFFTTGLGNVFEHIVESTRIAQVLAIVLVVGLVLAWVPLRGAARRRRIAMPAALAVGAILFLLLTAVRRSATQGPLFAERSRYVWVLVALLVPALAVAADAIARRWRWATPIFVVIFLLGAPQHVDELKPLRDDNPGTMAATNTLGDPSVVLAVANSPLLDQLESVYQPFRLPHAR